MLKKSMNIIDVYAWTKIYGKILENCLIDNIYSTETYWLFKIRCMNIGKTFLKIEPGKRIHLSRVEPPSKGIDKLVSFLRKHIRGGRIKGVELPGWERIIYIHVTSRNRSYILVVELIPRGFLVLLDDSNRILYADRFAELRDRAIKRGLEYKLPPGRTELPKLSKEELVEKLSQGRDLVRGIVKGWGLPGYVAEEILYRAGLLEKKKEKPSMLTKDEANKLITILHELLAESIMNKGYIVRQNNVPVLFTPYRPKLYEEVYVGEIEEFKDFNEAIDAYFAHVEKSLAIERSLSKIRGEIEKLRKSIEEQQRIIDKYREELDKLEKYMEKLTQNFALVDETIKCAQKTRKTHGWEKIPQMCGEVVSYRKDKGIIIVNVGDHPIEVNIKQDVWGNIRTYNMRIGELKKKIKRALDKLEELKKNIEEKEKETIKLETRVSRGIRPKLWFEKYHWLITSEGFLVIAGRDAGQNETIVRKYLSPNDIFLHADIHGAPATVIKTEGRQPSIKSIEEAAVLAACYSKAWKEGFGAVDVFWVKGEQVSKRPPSGEYLAKGAFMIYGKKNYLKIELKIALGVEEICDPVYGVYQRIIVGPEELVAERSLAYVVLVPGDLKGKDLVEKIMFLLRKHIGESNLSVQSGEIEYRIPGPSRIIRTSRGKGTPVETC